jgi:arabinose-5-phosphate isomerase
MAKPASSERPTEARAGDPIASAVRTLTMEASGITTLAAAIHDGLGKSFSAAVELISGARGRLIVTGMGKSGHIGRKIAATLASTGTPSFFVHPAEASHGDLGMVTADDIFIALSNSGETEELVAILPLIKRLGAKLIAITGRPESSLAQLADMHLNARV